MVVSCASLLARYDMLLCDIWGVLLDGARVHARAAEALIGFRAQGGSVTLLTNAPFPAGAVAGVIHDMGVPRAAYDAIVSSGDITRARLTHEGWSRVLHIGTDRDLPLFAGLDLARGALEEAQGIVCTGLYHERRESAADYDPLLARCLAHDLPMICANPDLSVEIAGRLIPCAGAIAERYAEQGGSVFFAGKPHGPIYEAALAEAERRRGAPIARAKVLAIGDGIRTDLVGAAGAGLDALFITGGLHRAELTRDGAIEEAQVAAVLAAYGLSPLAVAPWLAP